MKLQWIPITHFDRNRTSGHVYLKGKHYTEALIQCNFVKHAHLAEYYAEIPPTGAIFVKKTEYVCTGCAPQYSCKLEMIGDEKPEIECKKNKVNWIELKVTMQCPECGSDHYYFLCGECEYSEGTAK